MPEDSSERLQKILARAGVASRRKAEEMIQQGRVMINGQIVTQLGVKVDPAHDDIRVDGARLKIAPSHVYLLLNKPAGVLSVMEDERGRRSLGDLVPLPVRLYPVGRLDVNSEGLILLTDDGELANRLTHPRYKHEKEYRVLVSGHPADKTLEAWRRGVILEGRRTAPAGVTAIRTDKDATMLRIVMHEGRKRQIREVASLLGHPVRELVRVRMGPLQLGTLGSGQWRYLTDQEVRALEALKQDKSGSPKRKPAGKNTTRKGSQSSTSRSQPIPTRRNRRARRK
ncbi:MAG: rRNA pseudouridine synthase [Anaerolineae bacterium]|nr:rRNA pseudouridine synthase [Anaerolineae bacterium]